MLETPPRAWGRLGWWRLYAWTTEKHPHERGEDTTIWLFQFTYRETPPRAWGRPEFDRRRHSGRRNTPTSVGKTDAEGLPRGAAQKHPHERGEDILATSDRNPTMETPPRAWGRLVFPLTDFLLYKKHPHERGEDLMLPPVILNLVETPPRAWGRLLELQQVAGGVETPPRAWGRLDRFIQRRV